MGRNTRARASERGNHCRALGDTEREHFHRVERKEMMRQMSMGRLGALCAVGLVLFANLAWAQDPSQPIPGVIDLDPTNVKEVLNGMKITIAEFYAPWCGHCKRLTPEYTKLAEMVANDPMMSNFVQVVKADCDKHRSLGEPFSVTGFPTLKILSRGIGVDEAETAFDYNGARTAEDMLKQLKSYVEQDKVAFASSVETKAVCEDVLGGELYCHLMGKIIKKGDEYVTKEHARIGRIISKGKITRDKFADMVLKQNVLDAFKTT